MWRFLSPACKHLIRMMMVMVVSMTMSMVMTAFPVSMMVMFMVMLVIMAAFPVSVMMMFMVMLMLVAAFSFRMMMTARRTDLCRLQQFMKQGIALCHGTLYNTAIQLLPWCGNDNRLLIMLL